MRNIAFKIILFVLAFLGFFSYADAAVNPYGKYQSLYGITTVRCTWYAWDQAYKYTKVSLPSWGNAQTWYNSAINDGYKVGSKAKPNSIAVWSSADGYGHVGFVVSVEGNYMIVNEGGIVTEENEGIVNGSKKSINAGNLIGFIYLDKAPTVNNSIENNMSNNIISDNNEEEDDKKSNNNNLSQLTIDIDGFVFNPQITEYVLEVNYEVQIINIEAKAEDEMAIVTGAGQKALKVGDNIYKIVVKAENDDIKEYNITVKRNEESKFVSKDDEIKQGAIKRNKKSLVVPITLGIAFVSIIIIFIKFRKRIKH